MDTGDASRRRFGLVTRVNVRITETTFPLVRAYPRGLLLAACSGPSPIATKPVRSATTTSTVPLASTTTVPATTTTTGPPTTTTASTMPATTTTVSSPTTILGYFQQSGTGSFNSQLFALPPNAWWLKWSYDCSGASLNDTYPIDPNSAHFIATGVLDSGVAIPPVVYDVAKTSDSGDTLGWKGYSYQQISLRIDTAPACTWTVTVSASY